ncbi:MAG: hypothetical protein EOP07_08810 [Proteobacteria bacterium]|nr:MAG: hypothetical protein EOP07_08810 [Pseudomonadota bacterium]
MLLKIMEFNAQDFFLQLEYPMSREAILNISDEQWKLLGKDDIYLKPLSKIKRIADLIHEVNPDIVCLCEIGGFESLELFAHVFLDDAWIPYLLEGNSNRGIESGYLVKKSLPWTSRIKSHKNWPLPFLYPHEIDPVTYHLAATAAPYYDLAVPKDRRLSRDIPALILESEGRVRLVILLVHLKSGFDTAGVDLEGKVRRGAELKALLAIYQSFRQELGPDVPILMTGDFNGRAGRHDTAQEFLPLYENELFEDVLEIKEVPQYERISQMTFVKRNLIAQQLDFLFVTKDLSHRVKSAFVYRYRFAEEDKEIMLPTSFRDRTQLPSDHYPLVCELDLTL